MNGRDRGTVANPFVVCLRSSTGVRKYVINGMGIEKTAIASIYTFKFMKTFFF